GVPQARFAGRLPAVLRRTAPRRPWRGVFRAAARRPAIAGSPSAPPCAFQLDRSVRYLTPLENDAGRDVTAKRILLGITGGIAAYKSADLVRRLRERGAEVQVVMTAGGRRHHQDRKSTRLNSSHVKS